MNWIKRLLRRRTDKALSKTREITKPDIAGARVIDIHATSNDFDGYDCTRIYFTVDRGFSFTLPTPGYLWQTEDVPPTAERMPDEYTSGSFKVEGNWPNMQFIPGPSTKVDIVKQLKQRAIQGIYCLKMDEELGFYCPDDAIMLFDDGSQAYCITVAPHGTGATGLHYQTDVARLREKGDLVDFFEVPVERGRSGPGLSKHPNEGYSRA